MNSMAVVEQLLLCGPLFFVPILTHLELETRNLETTSSSK